MNVSIKDFLSDQIGRKLLIWSHLLKKSLMKNIILCAVLEGQSVFFLKNHSFALSCQIVNYIKPVLSIQNVMQINIIT